MSEQPRSETHRPNIVLRGGPFDGRHVFGDTSRTLAINDPRGPYFVYRPTGEADSEYGTLSVFVLDHMEPI